MAQTTAHESTLRHNTDGEIETTIPNELVDELELEGSQPVAFTPYLDGTSINFHVQLVDVNDEYSNVRRLKQVGEYNQTTLRWPRQLAEILGLHTLADTEDAIVEFDVVDDGDALTVAIWPDVKPWFTSRGVGQFVAPLKRKQLVKLRDDDHPLGIVKYRFELPMKYSEAYNLTAGDEVAWRISSRNGHLVLVMDLDVKSDDSHNQVMTILGHETSGRAGDTSMLRSVHVPKQVVHALGFGDASLVLKPEEGRMIVERAEDVDR